MLDAECWIIIGDDNLAVFVSFRSSDRMQLTFGISLRWGIV